MADDVFGQLRKSLLATVEGLQQVAKTVRASGFVEALPGYQQMRTVLLGQRLWCLREGRHELDPQWRDIEAAAREIAQMLLPFGEVMQSISRIEAFEAPSPRAATSTLPSKLIASAFEAPPDEDKQPRADDGEVLGALEQGPLSRSGLSTILKWDNKRLDSSLERLVAQKRISRRRYGKGMRITSLAQSG